MLHAFTDYHRIRVPTTMKFAPILLSLLPSSLAFSPPAFTLRGKQCRNVHVLGSTTEATEAGSYTLDGEKIRGPITPVGNFVLVRTKETVTTSAGGILLPDQSKRRATEGEVVAAGPGRVHPHTGVRITSPVEPGQNVLYGLFDGTQIKYNDEDMQMIRDDDIILCYTGPMMTLENITPCRDYLLVKVEKDKLETDSGIVVAASVTKELENCQGTVVKVGEGRMCSTGEFTPSPVGVGEFVKFRDYAGNDVKLGGEDYCCMRMVDILSVIPVEEEE